MIKLNKNIFLDKVVHLSRRQNTYLYHIIANLFCNLLWIQLNSMETKPTKPFLITCAKKYTDTTLETCFSKYKKTIMKFWVLYPLITLIKNIYAKDILLTNRFFKTCSYPIQQIWNIIAAQLVPVKHHKKQQVKTYIVKIKSVWRQFRELKSLICIT